MTGPVSERYEVIVIGGGAAGLMCALTAGQRGRRVLVLEHANRVGKKILMSGGGRCNFTHLHTTPEHFLSANPHFCKSALARYSPWDFLGMVERHGIGYHEKTPGQLFCDVSSKQIVRMLIDECSAAGVRIETGCAVHDIRPRQPGFQLATAQGPQHCDSLVIATGGLSIPSLGATGFGYELAKRFGHRLLPTRAGLVPLTLSGRPLADYSELAGISLPIEARHNGQSFREPMLFTHRGISGPAILQISSHWQSGPLDIDLLPDHPGDDWLHQARQQRPDAELRSALAQVLPRNLAQRLCERWLGSPRLRQLTPQAIAQLAERLHHWPITPSGTEGYRTAEVTLGGIDTDELHSSTFMSKKIEGLHFIGEVIDVTGQLGGFNFQWAWASGHAAGMVV